LIADIEFRTPEKQEPRRFPGGVRLYYADYSVIGQQAPPVQHDPPPQQSSSSPVAMGVAAVSVMSAASISMYFMTSPL
jgi:hypothetical protein